MKSKTLAITEAEDAAKLDLLDVPLYSEGDRQDSQRLIGQKLHLPNKPLIP